MPDLIGKKIEGNREKNKTHYKTMKIKNVKKEKTRNSKIGSIEDH